MPLPTGIDARSLRGVTKVPTGELLVFGDGGFAALISPAGTVEAIPTRDRDTTLLRAFVDQQGIAFAGERLDGPVERKVRLEPALNDVRVQLTHELGPISLGEILNRPAHEIANRGRLLLEREKAARDLEQ